jgi:hypothetical protein
MNEYIHYKDRCNICCWNLNLDGVGHELFNDLQKKNPEEDFWSCSRTDGWRIRTNYKLNKLLEGDNTVRFIKAQRLR